MIRRMLLATVMGLTLLAQTDDDRIYDEVRTRLANDRDVRGAGFEVTVKDGIVTIRGSVDSEKQKLKADKVAKKVKGVKSVVNELKPIAQ